MTDELVERDSPVPCMLKMFLDHARAEAGTADFEKRLTALQTVDEDFYLDIINEGGCEDCRKNRTANLSATVQATKLTGRVMMKAAHCRCLAKN